VRLQNQVRNAYTQINVQVKLRHELAPLLAEAAKASMNQERDALDPVIEAHHQAVGAHAKVAADSSDRNAMRQMAATEELLSSRIDSMLTMAEASPELKADQGISQLIEDLRVTGNRIAAARQAYNDSVAQYNASCRQFPVSIIAFIFAFKAAQAFDTMSEHGAKQASS
jgi:LemA protein